MVIGGHGLHRFAKGLQQAFGDWLVREKGQFLFQEAARDVEDVLVTRCFRVTWGKMDHKPESLAYRIESAEGRVVVYSGDTQFCEELVRLAGKADLLVCESSFPDEWPCRGHMTPSLAGKTARLAGVRRLVLTHLNPVCEPEDILAQCRKEFHGELAVAEDLMRIEL
jgi:ribonuclease BN (tRNA processing enzyme)